MAKVDPYGSWSINDNEEEFQNLLRIFDFPMESLEGDGLVGDWDASQLQNFGPIPPQMETVQPMIAQTKTESVFVDRKVGLNEATPELPNWFEETSCIRRHYKSTELQSQSPVSVLENGVRKGLLINSHINKRTRSKRARPSVNPWLLLSPIFPREMSKKPSQVEQAKKTFSDFAPAPSAAALQRPAAAKKCAHCEVTKTPQWREGPMGPKTLCNACGVRYRSGRLYPEYRPAASPTFVPSVHSNSHKKVVEMRTKGKQQKKVIGVEDSSVFVPVSGYL